MGFSSKASHLFLRSIAGFGLREEFLWPYYASCSDELLIAFSLFT